MSLFKSSYKHIQMNSELMKEDMFFSSHFNIGVLRTLI